MFETEDVGSCLVQNLKWDPYAAPELFHLNKWEGRTNEFFSELFIRASYSRLRSFVHHIVGDVKFDTQEKMFVLMKLRGFIGLLNRKLTGPGPEISVHQSVTVVCNIFFWHTTMKLHALQFTGDYST